MADLTHWDFAEHFKAKEAAELILGIPPEQSNNEEPSNPDEVVLIEKITPVLRRMERAYRCAGATLNAAATWSNPDSTQYSLEIFPTIPEELHSELMVSTRSDLTNFSLSLFGNNTELSPFNTVYFSREEIDRWLTAIGMQSVYPFNRRDAAKEISPTMESDKASHWPWGNHQTELLGHLEAAAKRFWKYYDPADATTAPINKDVSEWLVNERKASQKIADSIASILRADGLATGPRK
jgi:hypothetical protein